MKVEQLVAAIGALDAKDALQCKLTLQDWKALAPYLSMRFLKVGDPLMHEGDSDREVFILADGELEVSILGNNIATLQPGTVVGEGTFFSGAPRSATVTPSQPGVAWGLNAQFNSPYCVPLRAGVRSSGSGISVSSKPVSRV